MSQLMSDTRFPTALQIVVTVAVNEAAGVRTTSPQLAASLDTNPSFVRKIVTTLSKSGILISSDGVSGGIRLARPAPDIKLLEIHGSVLPEQKAWSARENIPTICSVTRNISAVSDQLSARADKAVAGVLEGVTVQDCIDRINQLDRAALTAASHS
jgi:Rrf2 family transcriptional regulator, repressor of oqxAB